MLTAAAFGIYLLGRAVSLLLRAAALLFVADAFGERCRQLVQVRGSERNQFLMIEQIFDALGQARPLGLGQIEGTEAQDEALAWAFIGAYRLQEAVIGVGDELSARFPAVDLGPALDLVAACATMVAAPPLPEPACSDPDDDKFLACAIAAGATYVVSGDRGLLASSPYRMVIVIRPRELVDRLTRRED